MNTERGEALIIINGKEKLLKFTFDAICVLLDMRDMSILDFNDPEKLTRYVSKPGFVRDAIYCGLRWADPTMGSSQAANELTFDEYPQYMKAVMIGISTAMQGMDALKKMEEMEQAVKSPKSGTGENSKSEHMQLASNQMNSGDPPLMNSD